MVNNLVIEITQDELAQEFFKQNQNHSVKCFIAENFSNERDFFWNYLSNKATEKLGYYYEIPHLTFGVHSNQEILDKLKNEEYVFVYAPNGINDNFPKEVLNLGYKVDFSSVKVTS